MLKILIASSIDSGAVTALQDEHDVVCAYGAKEDELISHIVDRDVLIFRSGVSVSREVMSAAPNLKLLIRAGSGLDNLDLDYIRSKKIPLVRIPGPGAQAVAELTFALLLSLTRQILVADRLLRQGHWAKYELQGHLLRGKTLGIIGAGNIGSRVGEMGVAWGMRVLGCVEHPTQEREKRLYERGIIHMECPAILATADYVSVHVPLKDTTCNLIGEKELKMMKPGAFLLNLSRGGVVDEGALFKALTNGGNLAGAALDVHREEGNGKISPLAGLSTVILTPHIGAMTIDSQRQIGERILEIINSFELDSSLSGVSEVHIFE